MSNHLFNYRGNGIPVMPHWWGVYKFQHAGVCDGSNESAAWAMSGANLAEVDRNFIQRFRPDIFHLNAGASRAPTDKQKAKELLALRSRLKKLDSNKTIDDYIALRYESTEEVLASGVYDHIPILRQSFNNEGFFCINEGNPICEILDPGGPLGFEEGLAALLEAPDKMERLIYGSYQALLPRMAALKEKGAHGYIGSETYCSSDLISPAIYRSLVFPAQKFFYHEIGKMGIVPITYFLGDINPLIGDIKQMGAKGLMIEESKKGFVLDVNDIYTKLEGSMTLFGNRDSIYTLLDGTVGDIKAETERQIQGKEHNFIMANGSPIAFNTPPEHIDAMIHAAHEQPKH